MVSNTQAPYMSPVTSQLAIVGLKPLSSASTPMFRVPPFFGVALETPGVPLVPPEVLPPALEDPELPHAARIPPAPRAAEPARNVRRSNSPTVTPLVMERCFWCDLQHTFLPPDPAPVNASPPLLPERGALPLSGRGGRALALDPLQ